MLESKKNLGKKFYQNLGKLFYAMAMADHSVHIKEMEKLNEVVRDYWLEVDDIEDEYGTDAAFQIISVFDWLCEHSAILEDFNVCIRAHPNVSIEEIMSQSLQTMPKNFTISCDSLETDLRRCWCVFYRHTSIGIQALLNGIPAIHLAVDVPLSGDPIEDLKSGKWVAHTPEELRIAIEKIRCLTSEDNSTMLNEAKNFLKGYFTPPTQEKLCDFVNI